MNTSDDDKDTERAHGLLLSESEFDQILDERLPFARLMGLTLDYFKPDHVRMRASYSERFLRPGGTIAGSGVGRHHPIVDQFSTQTCTRGCRS